MTTAELLENARGQVEKGWCQGAYAKDVNGETVWIHSPHAAAWDVWGALTMPFRFPDRKEPKTLIKSAWQILSDIVGEPFHEWQDKPGRTKDEVLAIISKATDIALQAKQ